MYERYHNGGVSLLRELINEAEKLINDVDDKINDVVDPLADSLLDKLAQSIAESDELKLGYNDSAKKLTAMAEEEFGSWRELIKEAIKDAGLQGLFKLDEELLDGFMDYKENEE